MSHTKKKLVIFDSNALIHRSFHALPPLTTKAGVQVNAVYGYVSVLLKVLKEIKPDYIVASFDLAGPTFRHNMYDEYKAGRVKAPQELYDQIPLTKEILETFGIPVLTSEGYEADDIIGTVSTMINKLDKAIEVIIVTGDMDTMQLINDSTRVFSLRKGVNDTVFYDEAAVYEKYKLTPAQIVDFKGLKGDPSDNIPGVPGIGDKTAQDLLAEFKTLDALYAYISKHTDYTKIPEHIRKILKQRIYLKLLEFKDQAYFSKELAQINTEVPLTFTLPDAKMEGFDVDRVKEIFKQYEFYSFIKRLNEMVGNTSPADKLESIQRKPSQPSMFGSEESSLPTTKVNTSNITIPSNYLILWTQEGQTRYIKNNKVHSLDRLEEIKSDLQNSEVTKIGYDIKPFLKQAKKQGIEPAGLVFDIKIAAYVLSPGERDYSFESICFRYGISPQSESNQLWNSMYPLMRALEKEINDKKLDIIFSSIEMPLTYALADMEYTGVLFDKAKIQETKKIVKHKIKQFTQEIYALAGKEFNINSSKQLTEILFEHLQVSTKGIKKTLGGKLSTSARSLTMLAKDYPIVDKVLQYREVTKLENTYINALPQLCDEQGRIHTTFEQTIAATGRLSSINPNLQNIPVKSELGNKIKQAFVAPKGYKLVSIDYSQIELRLAAHLSQDPAMIQIFKSGQDIHTATAARTNNIAEANVTNSMRGFAKTINFGILYGMGVVSLAENLKISRKEASEFLKNYKQTFPKLMLYLEFLKEYARQHGHIRTEFGRIRYFNDLSAENPRDRAAIDRLAINMPIQGLQADIIKLAMIKIYELIQGKKDIKMLLQVHDELVFEIKDHKVENYSQQIKLIMESVYDSSVPIKVDISVDDFWN